MNLLDLVRNIATVGAELKAIREQLTRLADAAEGRTAMRIAPELPEEPAELAPAHTDQQFAQIEDIELRYLAIAGRLPTADEICRELDGEPVPEEVSMAELKRQQARRSRGDL